MNLAFDFLSAGVPPATGDGPMVASGAQSAEAVPALSPGRLALNAPDGVA
jgi:hypothetical protein